MSAFESTEADDEVSSSVQLDVKLASFIDSFIVPILVQQYLAEYKRIEACDQHGTGQYQLDFRSGSKAA